MIGSRHSTKNLALGIGIVALAAALLGGCAEELGQGGLWECRAHSGPEPAELLDWRSDHDEPHPDVSCRVGVGIRAGWWHWHELSGHECRHVAVSASATAELPEGQSRSRRDAREPILLNAGDVVTGFTTEDSGATGYIAATSISQCFLEFVGTEPPTSEQ
ncbi:hypothetical protein [Candidatus Poriferisodalis sp.]|uniref:hypothetical protein n=1 Tax=Candidatus Poriferisodalis sp. TaxID=3101277 RepID=UPI003B01646C